MKETMEYTYSSYPKEDKDEAKRILQQYIPPEESLVDQIKTLDEKAKRPGIIFSLVIGIIGTLTLGSAMSLIFLSDLMLLGIIIGITGILIMAIAYPVYLKLFKIGKSKYGGEIKKLSDKLLNQ